MRHLVRHRTLQGTVTAAGYVFETNLMSETEMRKRILARWKAGASLFQLPFGRLLLLAHPETINTNCAPGLPIVKHGNIFISYRIDNKYKQPLLPDSTVCLFRGNELCAIVTDNPAAMPQHSCRVIPGEPEDPAAWFSAENIPIIETEFPEIPRETGHARPLQEEITDNVRKQLNLPAPDKEMLSITEELRDRQKRKQQLKGTFSSPLHRPARVAQINNPFASLLQKPARALLSFLSRQTQRINQYPPAHDKLPKQFKALNQIKNTIKRLLVRSALANVLGKRQAQYFNDMIKELESGDITEALHKAIPLGNDIIQSFTDINLGLPNRRQSLDISYNTSGGSSYVFEDSFIETLKDLYRKVFKRLVTQERLDEAAFVLAELLQENEEAVAFLEKNRLYQKAAELAEGRKLDPAIAIRQWFLAGNKERAVNLAILYNSFSEAVTLLENDKTRQSKKIALELRRSWADMKAQSGFNTLAATIIKDNNDDRPKMLLYLKNALQDEGPEKLTAISMLMRYFPEENVFGVARSIIDDEDENRNALLQEIVALKAYKDNASARTLLRHGARVCLKRSAATPLPGTINEVLSACGDRALLEDLKRCSRPWNEKTSKQKQNNNLVISHSDQGSVAIHQAVLLRNNRILLTLGEAGSMLLNSNGRVTRQYDEPAYTIVPSTSGNKMLLIAPRGRQYRISRLDLNNHTCTYWCDAPVTASAETYDGLVWPVACDREFIMADVRGEAFHYFWHSGDLNGTVQHIVHQTKYIVCVVSREISETETEIEYLRYELPMIQLRDRCIVTISKNMSNYILALDNGNLAMAWHAEYQNEYGNKKTGIMLQKSGINAGYFHESHLSTANAVLIPLELYNARLIRKAVSTSHIVVSMQDDNCVWVFIITLFGTIEKRILLEGAKQVYTQFHNNNVLITDDKGRLLLYNLQSGECDINQRIHV